jgi:predicted RNase H-like HicB family nuclease
MKFTVVLEQGASSYGAFVPDLPGCIAAAETKEEVLQLIKEAIEFHIESIMEEGKQVPIPHCDFAQIEVKAA